MTCPECGEPTVVFDSRTMPEGYVRRVRDCRAGHRFQTGEFPLVTKKRKTAPCPA